MDVIAAANPQHWFKMDATTGVDGDLIASIVNFGSAGGTATAAGSARPTLKTGIQSGRSVLRFDGTANVMVTPTIATTAKPITLFVVCRWTKATWVADEVVCDGSSNSALISRHSATEISMFGGVAHQPFTLDALAWHVIKAEFPAGSVGNLGADGTYANTAAAPGGNTYDSVTLGAATSPSSAFAQVDIGEYIVFKPGGAGLDTPTATAVAAALKAKWATP